MVEPARLRYPVDVNKNDRDAEFVTNNARFVLFVDMDGYAHRIIDNDHGSINVIVVIGPADIGNSIVTDTILLEIGLWRTRPYRKTEAPGHKGTGRKRQRITYRRRFASLSAEQTVNVWPSLEHALVQYAKERIAQWGPGSSSWCIPTQEEWPNLKRKRIGIRLKNRVHAYPRGVRCAIAGDDQPLRDILITSDAHSHLRMIGGRARFVNVCLEPYIGQYIPPNWMRENAYREASKIGALVDNLLKYDMPSYFFSMMLERQLIQKESVASFLRVLEEFNLGDPEEILRMQRLMNDGPRFQAADIQLLPKRRWSQKFIVFEIFPSSEEDLLSDTGIPTTNPQERVLLEEAEKDDIPF